MASAALSDTRWSELMHFWDTNVQNWNGFVVFGEKPDVAKMLQLDRKIPEMFLMGERLHYDLL